MEKRSANHIGYVKLTDMSVLGLKEFTRAIAEYRLRDGLIIDVRNNPGGSIETQIIEALERHAYMMISADREVRPMWRPNNGFYGHVALLCNQYSWSDAELMPFAFSARKLGRVFGLRTAGFNLGSPNYPLIDNGFVRQGISGLWMADGRQLEGSGSPADIEEIHNEPNDFQVDNDAQLNAAINYLLGEIRDHPVVKPQDVERRYEKH